MIEPYASGKRWTLYAGDCLTVIPTLPKVDAVITDPPFGIGFAAQPTKWQRRAGHQAKEWDDDAPNVLWLLDVAEVVAVWGGNYFGLPITRGWLIWTKPDAPPSMGTVEMCWTNADRPAKHIEHSISSTNRERCGHPTQKPIRVMLRTLDFVQAPVGGVVLDPFAGSGSTGIAALETGRRFIGIEREPAYLDIAARRLAQTESDGEQVGLFR